MSFKGHTATYKGAMVMIETTDGERIHGRFVHRTRNGRIELDSDGELRVIRKADIAKFLRMRGGRTRPM